MNIQSLAEGIELFEEMLINSGFYRDVQDYSNSLSENQSNILALREIARNIEKSLDLIYNSDLPNSLNSLFPKKNIRPFTERNFLSEIKDLQQDSKIELSDFFSNLYSLINDLYNKIQETNKEIEEISEFIDPYLEKTQHQITSDSETIISIIFKDPSTITNLPNFTKDIQNWNRTLLLYNQILYEDTQDDVKIIEVQNGSIDFVISLNIEIGMNLIELFKIGFQCYAAYLSYKKMLLPITKAYFGNQRLLESEKERETEMIKNISLAIDKEIRNQYQASIDNKLVSNSNVEKNIEQVTKLITTHIIKGNDVKLLAQPKIDDEKVNSKQNNMKSELIETSREVRAGLKDLPKDELKQLLEYYTDDSEEQNKTIE